MVDVVDPSRFVVLTPAPRSHFFGSVGASYFSYIWVPEHSVDDPWTGHKSPLPKLGLKGLHSKQSFNYLMADGSVKNMIFEETYNTANSINMWNINGN